MSNSRYFFNEFQALRLKQSQLRAHWVESVGIPSDSGFVESTLDWIGLLENHISTQSWDFFQAFCLRRPTVILLSPDGFKYVVAMGFEVVFLLLSDGNRDDRESEVLSGTLSSLAELLTPFYYSTVDYDGILRDCQESSNTPSDFCRCCARGGSEDFAIFLRKICCFDDDELSLVRQALMICADIDKSVVSRDCREQLESSLLYFWLAVPTMVPRPTDKRPPA